MTDVHSILTRALWPGSAAEDGSDDRTTVCAGRWLAAAPDRLGAESPRPRWAIMLRWISFVPSEITHMSEWRSFCSIRPRIGASGALADSIADSPSMSSVLDLAEPLHQLSAEHLGHGRLPCRLHTACQEGDGPDRKLPTDLELGREAADRVADDGIEPERPAVHLDACGVIAHILEVAAELGKNLGADDARSVPSAPGARALPSPC